MVRIIMAAVGILFICLGGSYIGTLLLLPALFTILLKIANIIHQRVEHRHYIERCEKKEREEKLAEERKKQEAVAQQDRLREQYKTSPLTNEVIETISGGSLDNIPEEIVITNHWIQGSVNGRKFKYDFASNRVRSFETVIRVIERKDELKYIVRPQIAMAEALDFLLNNKFIIYDNAKQEYNNHTDIDGDSYTTITYTSDHVTMVLKSTLPNRTF